MPGLYALLSEGRRDFLQFHSYRLTSKQKSKTTGETVGLRQSATVGMIEFVDIMTLLPSVRQFMIQAQANFDTSGSIWPCTQFQVWPTRGHAAIFLDVSEKQGKLNLSVWLTGYTISPLKKPTHFLQHGIDRIQFLAEEIDEVVLACASAYDNLFAEQACEHVHCTVAVPLQYPLCHECHIPMKEVDPKRTNPLKDIRQQIVDKYAIRGHPFH